ncbi:MAG: hypothetical protein U0905_00675 [Pirellulales bacterium]
MRGQSPPLLRLAESLALPVRDSRYDRSRPFTSIDLLDSKPSASNRCKSGLDTSFTKLKLLSPTEHENSLDEFIAVSLRIQYLKDHQFSTPLRKSGLDFLATLVSFCLTTTPQTLRVCSLHRMLE